MPPMKPPGLEPSGSWSWATVNVEGGDGLDAVDLGELLGQSGLARRSKLNWLMGRTM